MRKLKTLFALLVFSFFTIGNVWGETINITANNFASSYSSGTTFTAGGCTFWHSGAMYTSKNSPTTGMASKQFIQLRKSSSGAGEIKNNTELALKSITIATQNDKAFTLSAGTASDNLSEVAKPAGSSGTYQYTKDAGAGGGTATCDVTIYTFNVSGKKYFDILNGSNASYIAYITIELAEQISPIVSLTPSSLTNLNAEGVGDQTVTVSCSNFTSAITSIETAFFNNPECSGDAISTPTWIEDFTKTVPASSDTTITFSVADNDGAARATWLRVIAKNATEADTAILPISQKLYVAPLTTMDAILAAAKANGSTAQEVKISFDNWVVSGVSGSNVYVTDGTKGFVIYKSGHGFAVNDKLNGTVIGSLKLYNGLAEEVSITATTPGLTVTHDGVVTPVEKAISALDSVNTGAPIIVKKVRYNGTNLVDAGDNTIKPYNTLYAGMAFTNGKLYDVTGIYVQYQTTKEIAPRSAADIVEIPEPTVTVKNNASETIASMAFGNVGQRWQQSFVFGFSYENLEAGDLTMTIGGTNASAFAFSGGLTETVNIASAGNGTVSMLSFHQATQVAGDYEATLTFTGCGLTSPVVVPITMSVKEPVFTYTPATIAFGNVKQHTKATETFTLTGRYLKKSGWSNVKMLSTGIFDPLSEGESYFISSDENGEINETVTVTCDATDASAGAAAGTLTLTSMELVPEFADKEEVVSFSATIIATYGVRIVSGANGHVSVNSSASTSDTTVYVVDEDEEIDLVATPNVGYEFVNWTYDDNKVLLSTNADVATTTAFAYEADIITANFQAMSCTSLAAPTLDEVTTTYNSATIAWNSVTNADGYVLNITKHSDASAVLTDEIIAAPAVSFEKTGLAANTQYDYTVMAMGDGNTYCDENNSLLNGSFTTDDYPAATLTLSENGATHDFPGENKLNDEITLPSTVSKGVDGKVFVGWSADAERATAPEYAKGASYTLSSTTQTLYAVYATENQGATSTWVLISSDIDKPSGSGSGYAAYDGEHTKSGISFTTSNVMQGTGGNAGKIQFKSGSGMLYNTDAFAKDIQSITIAGADMNVYADDEAITSTPGSGAIAKTNDVYPVASGNRFFHLKMGGSTGYVTSITVTLVGDVTYSNYATTGAFTPTGFDNIESEVKAVKVLKDGQIYILRGEKVYTIQGQLVK